MIASEARIAANRANALKSTGPRTAEGKERSRQNALKHGLTGGGVVLPGVDADAVEVRAAGFEAAYRPATEVGKALVRRAAMLSVRIERCEVRESAAIATKVRVAEADFDEAREAEVDHLMETIGEAPAVAVRRLLRMPEGVDRMLDAWRDLRSDLAHGDGSRWTVDHAEAAHHLLGRRFGGLGLARVGALCLALEGDFSLLTPADGAGLDPVARRDRARLALIELIDGETARLVAHRESLDFDAIEADRAGAAARALFDPSKEASLARKYEAAAERAMHRALKEMRAVEAEAAETAEIAPRPGRALASFSPPPFDRPASSFPKPPAPAPMPRPVAAEGSSFVPMTIGRPSAGPA